MRPERMLMMNVVGDLSDMDNILSTVVSDDIVQIVDANDLISHSEFLFPINTESIDMAVDFNYIRKYKKDINIKEEENKLNLINKYLKLNLDKFDENNNLQDENINEIYDEILKYIDQLIEINSKIEDKNELVNRFNIFKKLNIDITDLHDMGNFSYKFGVLSKDDRLKIKRNYENIFAAIFHLSSAEEGEVYLIIYPSNMEVDINRTLKSLNFQEMYLSDKYEGTPVKIVEKLNIEIEELNKDKEKIQSIIDERKTKYENSLKGILRDKYNLLYLETIKNNIAISDKFFYLAGWIGKSDSDKLKKKLEDKFEVFVQFNNMDESESAKPPTKLKNNFFFKPFELLVKMYGTPNYNELDPTVFFGITYMILFGAMFGDIGQGLVFILAGILVSHFSNPQFGKLFKRLGFSSVIFGFLYGSFFGLEEIFPALFIRPYDNINTILIMAICLGIVLLLMSYVLGIYNLKKENNLEELLFGEKGITGLVLYLLLLLLVVKFVLKINIMPTWLNGILIAVAILLMIFKKPITSKIEKKDDLYGNDKASNYYIEGSFSIIETLISIFSGTISFIRVGAFAINHVGLFLAFSTIGKMLNSSAGNIAMMIFGNILILGLEGLIVFIQALRLEYYEMFSKYYKGDGVDFIANKNKF